MVPSTTVTVARASAVVCLWLAAAARADSSDEGGDGEAPCNFVEFSFPAHSPDGGCFYNELVGDDEVRSYSAQCGGDGALTVWEYASADCSGAATDVTATDERVGNFECGGRFCPKVRTQENWQAGDGETCVKDARGLFTTEVVVGPCSVVPAEFGVAASAQVHGCQSDGRRPHASLHPGSSTCAGEATDAVQFFQDNLHEADCWLTCEELAAAESEDSDEPSSEEPSSEEPSSEESSDESSDEDGCNYLTWEGLAWFSPDGSCFHNEFVSDAEVRSYRAECGGDDDEVLTVWEYASLDCSGPGTDVTATEARVGEHFECGREFCPVLHVVADPRTEDEQACAPPDARGALHVALVQGLCVDLSPVFGELLSLVATGCDEAGRLMVGEAHEGSVTCDAAEPQELIPYFTPPEADCYLACTVEAPLV